MLSPAATTTDKRGTDKRGSLTTQQRSPVELSEKVAQKILALEQAAHNFKVQLNYESLLFNITYTCHLSRIY